MRPSPHLIPARMLVAAGLLAAAAGCGDSRTGLSVAPANEAAGGAPPATGDESYQALSSREAGPFRLGMKEVEVLALPDHNVFSRPRKVGEKSVASLVVQKFGMPLVRLDLANGVAERIEVFSPAYATPDGARVGMDAGELEKRLGPGKVTMEEKSACAGFDRAPGMRFCFQEKTGKPVTGARAWGDLRRAGVRVRSIVLLGDPGSGGEEASVRSAP